MHFLLFCSTISSSGCGCPEGQSSAGRFSQAGPSHHLACSSCWTVHLVLGRSAGFMTPGTCRQDSFEVSCRISCTRFHTKTPQWCSVLIQAITVDKSLQKDSVISLCSSSFTMDVANLAPMVAANRSSLGIVTDLTGATLDLS
jgi:hypothetical protein